MERLIEDYEEWTQMLGVNLFFVTFADLNPLTVEAIRTVCRANRLNEQSRDPHGATFGALGPLLLDRLFRLLCKVLLLSHYDLLLVFLFSQILEKSDDITPCFDSLLQRLAGVF
jgi:hypothetical protein